jgi:hypothetical protein
MAESLSTKETLSSDAEALQVKQEEPVHEVPDGGLRAWMTVLGG